MQLSAMQHKDMVYVNHNKQNYIWKLEVFREVGLHLYI